MSECSIHRFLDCEYGPDGDRLLRERLASGIDLEQKDESGETPLHVATRRRRKTAVAMLLDCSADINATDAFGKTAFAHSIRRGFDELVDLFIQRGASTDLNAADRFAVAVTQGRLDEAQTILDQNPGVAQTGNPAEDRLLADMAGRPSTECIVFLIRSGADLSALALDGGTPLHQAAWFGQPDNAKVLIHAGAPLDVFESVHGYSPIGWVAHGSAYSGGAKQRQSEYTELARLLLDAGCSLKYPGDPSDDYLAELHRQASPAVKELLPPLNTG